MPRAAKPANEGYIEVGYEDKIVFTPKKNTKCHPDVVATWRSSQGLWVGHPFLGGMAIEGNIEWVRGEEYDV